ncbi:MAG: hypothetical protein EXS10_07335 [Phycisphaerales bacterium]|nr:hypothetical protein [Phycisphaerales bacterium]
MLFQRGAVASSSNENNAQAAPSCEAAAKLPQPPKMFDPTAPDEVGSEEDDGSNEKVKPKVSWTPPEPGAVIDLSRRWAFSFEPSAWVPLNGIDVAQSIIAMPMAQLNTADAEIPDRFGFAGKGEAWYDEVFGVVLDGRIVQLDDADLGNGLGTRSFFVDAQTAFRVLSDDEDAMGGVTIDLLAGTRVYAVEQGTLAPGSDIEAIAGVLVGARASWQFVEGVDFAMQADIGGTNLAADPSWGATAQAAIALPEHWLFSLNAGWRTLDETFMAPIGTQSAQAEDGVATGAMWIGFERRF